jgi:hypothetical protein
MVPESINSREIHESMLLADINIDNLDESHRDNYNFVGYS